MPKASWLMLSIINSLPVKCTNLLDLLKMHILYLYIRPPKWVKAIHNNFFLYEFRLICDDGLPNTSTNSCFSWQNLPVRWYLFLLWKKHKQVWLVARVFFMALLYIHIVGFYVLCLVRAVCTVLHDVGFNVWWMMFAVGCEGFDVWFVMCDVWCVMHDVDWDV